MEIVVASGKGGTGKTFVSSNLLHYLVNEVSKPSIGVDADAEAPDLVLALGGSKRVLKRVSVGGFRKARIDRSKCVKCLKCFESCRFGAITVGSDGYPAVDPYLCEGCGVCAYVCPASCVSMEVVEAGEVRVEETGCGPVVVSANLSPGARATGHVVYVARDVVAKELARELGAKHVVTDAAAGIGCAVVSSMVGADLLLLVVEPLPPSIEGGRRLAKLAEKMRLRALCIVNKYTLNEPLAKRVGEELGVEVVGRIPYDRVVAESYAMMKPLLAYAPTHPVAKALRDAFSTVV